MSNGGVQRRNTVHILVVQLPALLQFLRDGDLFEIDMFDAAMVGPTSHGSTNTGIKARGAM